MSFEGDQTEGNQKSVKRGTKRKKKEKDVGDKRPEKKKNN